MAHIFAFIVIGLVSHLSAVFASRRSSASIPPLQLITSPQSCVSDVECPLDKYCKEPSVPSDFFIFHGLDDREASTCVPRLPQGSNCTYTSSSECEEGTVCAYVGDLNPTPICVRPAPEGASCASPGPPCQTGLLCKIDTCRHSGFEGDFCEYSGQCQLEQGLFCLSSVSQCTRKRSPGDVCGGADEFDCEGFCVESSPDNPGVCQRLQIAGEKCNDNDQCRGSLASFQNSRSVDLLCNRPTGVTGICVLETDLIRELGAPCNPDSDTCDARRGLSCGRVGRQFKCVQRATAPDTSKHFCTPNSPLSSCPDSGNLRECRRGLSLSKEFVGSFKCRTRRQYVPLGNPCNNEEFAVCQEGAVCAEAPGVRRRPERRPPLPPRLRTCMKVLPVGAPCVDQFRFKCEEGSFCVNGTCRREGTPPVVPLTFASIDDDCSELSCPPGTVCVGDPDEPESPNSCRLPVQEVGLRRPCFDSAQFQLRCKDDLQCSLDLLDQGVRLCRPKRGIGEVCEDDESCIGNLLCDRTSREEPFKRRCFDPSLVLNIGDSCNPFPRPDEPRCMGAVERGPRFEFVTDFEPLECLPKNGANMCQRAVGLFQQCSAEQNIACGTEDLVCNEFNVCVPKSQVYPEML